MTRDYDTIARAYDAAPLVPSGAARAAYRLVAAYTDARYFGSIPSTGWRIQPIYHDGLPDIPDAQRTRVIPVFDLAHGHPCLSDAENFRFRAVHDLYGHDWLEAHGPAIGLGVANEQVAAAEQIADFRAWYWFEGLAGGVPTWNTVDGYDVEATTKRLAVYTDACAALRGEIYGQAAYHAARGKFPKQKAFLLYLPWRERGTCLP